MTLLTQYRLQNQAMEYPYETNPVALLARFAAIQGQDYVGAKWSLGLRLPQTSAAQIEQAIADGQIVRTWLMRGTLFLTTAQDVRWLLELVAPHEMKQSQRRYQELELDEKTLARSHEIVLNALEQQHALHRQGLYRVLEEQGISTEGQRGVHLVRHSSLLGAIVQKTMHKNNDPFFVRLDSLPVESKTLPKEAALAELAQRYFQSRGWATLQDFAWWSGLPMADVRAGFEGIRSELVEEKLDGTSYWRLNATIIQESPPSPMVYLPAGFDEYLLGYKNRDAVLDPNHAEKVCPGKNGVFFPTFVIDGQIRGIWKRKPHKTQALIDVLPFSALTEDEKAALHLAFERYGQFLDMPIAVSDSLP